MPSPWIKFPHSPVPIEPVFPPAPVPPPPPVGIVTDALKELEDTVNGPKFAQKQADLEAAEARLKAAENQMSEVNKLLIRAGEEHSRAFQNYRDKQHDFDGEPHLAAARRELVNMGLGVGSIPADIDLEAVLQKALLGDAQWPLSINTVEVFTLPVVAWAWFAFGAGMSLDFDKYADNHTRVTLDAFKALIAG